MRAGASIPERIRAWVPRWWRGETGTAGALMNIALAPAEAAYRGIVRARLQAYSAGALRSYTAPIPVVSVGNIAVGGAGKTPISAWIAGCLEAAGRNPAVVLRGYGADEILVHRELNPRVPVFPAAARIEGVRQAARAGRDVAVLDDGFQHRALRRDLDIVLIAAESWTPRPKLLPRGPWREAPDALRRADLLIVTRKTASRERAAEVSSQLQSLSPGAGIAIAHLVADQLRPLSGGGSAREISSLAGEKVLAVASLADPRPFVQHLTDAGGQAELASFPDHHDFSAGEAAALHQRAAGRPLVMTRKDAVKLQPLLPGSSTALVLDQRVEIEMGRETIDAELETVVGR